LLITLFAVLSAIVVIALLSFAPFSRTQAWRATVTPLASIIGSGFLICGPLLAKEFGFAASAAMAILLLISYTVGSVVRFNISHAESYLAAANNGDVVVWMANIGQVVLAVAYAISVAYYLKLLAEFTLKNVASFHALLSNALVTALILTLMGVAFSGGLRRVERVAHATVSIKLGVIAGLLVALAVHWYGVASAPIVVKLPEFSFHKVSLLLGLLITVQGFEVSRYLGRTYQAEMRIRTMRYAQWLSSAVYLAFLILLTPFLTRAAQTPGVAGILDIMAQVAPFLGLFVLLGAVSSQLSAAVADSIGASGLLTEVSRGRLTIRASFLFAGLLAIGVVWLTDPFEVVALSSRAFAVFYAFQCAIAFLVSLRTRRGGTAVRFGLLIVGLVCLLAAVAGAPAE
jgi:hypothetical protein